jgi:phosphoglycolate phosphatase-like HAD superfamily hydrolase
MRGRTAPQAIFFDVDGVLIDSLGIKGEAFARAFSEFPNRRDQIVSFHLANGGVTRVEKLALIFQSVLGRKPTPDELDARVAVFAAHVVDAVIAAPEIRGAALALAKWSKRVPLHALSATPADELVHILEQRGLIDFFTSVRGWPPKKTTAVKGLLDEHGYEPDQCVLVGDSREDLNAARSARIHFVQVSRSPELDFAESRWVIRDLVGLSDAIESLPGPTTQ